MGVALIALISLQPLVFGPIRGHDTFAHYFRIAEVDALWRQGVWFSRWSPNLMFGYGYPLYNFYPPLSVSALTLIYRVIGENGPLALNITFGMTLACAVMGMFLLGRHWYGNVGGLFAAAAYGWSPHLLYQTFERGSLSNAVAMALYPLAAATITRVAQHASASRMTLASLVVAAVFLSHLTSSLIFLPVLILVGGLAALKSARPRQNGSAVAVTCAGGLALSAFFWLPAILQFHYTQWRTVTSGMDYRDHFTQVWQWPGRVVDGVMNPPLPVTTGLAPLALGLAAFALSVMKLWRNRLVGREWTEVDLLAALGGALSLVTTALATRLSSPAWQVSAYLRDFWFPWRWLDVSAFLFSLQCGWLVAVAGPKRLWRVGLISVCLIVMFANALPYLYPPRTHVLPARPTLTDASAAQRRYDIGGLTGGAEYLPATARWRPRGPAFPGADENATLARKLRRASLPAGAVLEAAGGPLRADITINVSAPTPLVFDTLYFPGWQATLDGQRLTVRADSMGLLMLTVPTGKHRVTVHFGWTAVRALADSLSGVAALLCVMGILWPRRPLRPDALDVSRFSAIARREGGIIVGVLVALALAKLAWFDTHDSPLVTHMRASELPDLARPEWRDFAGELKLLGYTMGANQRLTLYWQAQRTLSRNYAIQLTLMDARGGLVGDIRQPNPGVNSTGYWEAGLIARDTYRIPVSANQIALAVRDSQTGVALPLRDSPNGQALDVMVKPYEGDMLARQAVPCASPNPESGRPDVLIEKDCLEPVTWHFGGVVLDRGARG